MATGRTEHERRDVDIRGIVLFGLALMAVVLVALGAMLWLFEVLARREAGRQPTPATLTARPADQLPPAPRLQEDPVGDLAAVRAEEEALLDSYGWIDQQKGIARIPVERAMEIVVDRGVR